MPMAESSINLLRNRRFSISQGMISGQQEQSEHVYEKLVGKSGKIWYVATDVAWRGELIYVWDGNLQSRSNGFGGALLTFKLVDGTEEKAKGPWHSNSSALLLDTGLDVSHLFRTQGIVSRERQHLQDGNDAPVFIDVVHYDPSPVLGKFDRVRCIAQEYADKEDRQIFYSMISRGGGTQSWCNPKKKEA